MLRNFLKSFLLSFLLLAGGAFTAADLPLKAAFFVQQGRSSNKHDF